MSNTTLGKYQLLEEIGRGGMGAVYKAYDPMLDRTVAIKLLAPHLVWEKDFVERFLREARAAGKLRHPNLIEIHDVGQEGEQYYFVMTHLPGGTLKQRMQKEGALSPAEISAVLRPLADALDYAHAKGLVHRDVKPTNVMFDERGQPVLTDFGIVKAAQETKLTVTGSSMGTPQYMAPEQVLGKPIDARTDQYALAAMSFELLAGKVPFDGDTTTSILYKQVHERLPSIPALRPGIPAAVDKVLDRAMAKSPDDRYPTCAAFVDALSQALGQPAAEALPIEPIQQPVQPGAGVIPVDLAVPGAVMPLSEMAPPVGLTPTPVEHVTPHQVSQPVAQQAPQAAASVVHTPEHILTPADFTPPGHHVSGAHDGQHGELNLNNTSGGDAQIRHDKTPQSVHITPAGEGATVLFNSETPPKGAITGPRTTPRSSRSISPWLIIGPMAVLLVTLIVGFVLLGNTMKGAAGTSTSTVAAVALVPATATKTAPPPTATASPSPQPSPTDSSTPSPSETPLPSATTTPLPSATETALPTKPPTAVASVTKKPAATQPPSVAGNLYPAPAQVAPASGSYFALPDIPTLSWTSVGNLGVNDYYFVQIDHSKGIDPYYVKATSVAARDYLPSLAMSTPFTWRVSVVRKNADGSYTPVSPVSGNWTFTWVPQGSGGPTTNSSGTVIAPPLHITLIPIVITPIFICVYPCK